MKIFTLLAIFLAAGDFALGAYDPNSWTFSMQGEWPLNFPFCLGMRQSPINIETCDTISKKFKDNLKYERIDTIYPNMTIITSNRTVRVTAPFVKKPSIKTCFDNSINMYNFDHLHFHLGLKNYDGSEHAINSRKYPLELHYVWIKKNYGSLPEAFASNDTQAIVIIAVIYKICGDDDEALQPIMKAIAKGENTTRTNLDLNSLLECVINTPFFTYLGSLEAPKCNEVVRWIVYEKIMELSKKQMETLWKVKFNGVKVFPNFRLLQPVNRRPVYYYK